MKPCRTFLLLLTCAACVACSQERTTPEAPPVMETRPNILWLSAEDMSPTLGCYGDPYAKTPNIDGLAERGWLYENAHVTSPVCAPTRASIITGMWASTLGVQNMRVAGKKGDEPPLPDELRMFPALLRDQGYYCTNNYKEDYNVQAPPDTWDESSEEAHWKNRPDPDQPFFAVFNSVSTHQNSVNKGFGVHNSRTKELSEDERYDASAFELPEYLWEGQRWRDRMKRYYELVVMVDHWVGRHLRELEEQGVADNTIVVFWTDHGWAMPRGKTYAYDSGTHIPIIVHVPDALRAQRDFPAPGARLPQLVSSLSLPPSVLDFAGVSIPTFMQAGPLPLDSATGGVAFATCDRMSYRIDLVRSVRTPEHRYIINLLPWRAYYRQAMTPLVPLQYAGNEPDELWIKQLRRPVEELYYLPDDPDEVNNLAQNPEHQAVLEDLRTQVRDWHIETKDTGCIPEPALERLAKKHGNRYHIVDAWGTETHAALWDLAVRAAHADPGNLSAFLAAAEHELSPFRYWAAQALRQLAPAEEAVAALQTLQDDPAGEVRVVAAQALAEHGASERAVQVLAKAAESDEQWVRLHAVFALEDLGELGRPALPVLRKAAKDPNNYVSRIAGSAIAALDNAAKKTDG